MNDSGFFAGSAIFMVLGLVGIVLLLPTSTHRATLRFQIQLFLAAYSLRFAMSVALYTFGLVNLIKDEDGSGWRTGFGYYQGWVQQGLGLEDAADLVKQAIFSSNRGYYYFLAFLFCVVPPARMPAAVFNCFFGAFAIVFAYRTAASLFSNWVARRVGIWLCIFPSMLIWSAQTVKEPVVILLETMVVYGCVRLRQSRFPLPHMIMVVTCIIFLIPFRFYAAYLAAAALIVSSILPASGRAGYNISAKLSVITLCGFFVTTGVLAQHEAQYTTWDLDQLQNVRSYTARTTGSGVGSSLDVRTSGGFGLQLVVGGLHLLLAPFPWQLASGSARMLMVAPEMLFWWWLVFAGVLPGLSNALRKRFNDTLPLLTMLLGFGLLYSVMFMNVGLIYRQRAQLLPWLLTFGAFGLELRKKRQLARFATRRGPADGLVTFTEPERGRELAVRPPLSGTPTVGPPRRPGND